jgi:hypothetical protein
MAKRYVETFRAPREGLQFCVHLDKHFSRDVLSPNMTAVFEVDCVQTKNQAIACVIEKLAGFDTNVRLVFGGNKK